MIISLHEFGKRAGCNYTTASRLLSGDRAPSTKMLNNICEAFGLDHGKALQALQVDQKRDDGKSSVFAAYLKKQLAELPEEQAPKAV